MNLYYLNFFKRITREILIQLRVWKESLIRSLYDDIVKENGWLISDVKVKQAACPDQMPYSLIMP